MVGIFFCLNQESLLTIYKNIVPVEFNQHHYRDPSLMRNYVGFAESGQVVFNG